MNEYTLLIVDDEPLVRDHMAHILDWSRLGVTKILEAANGYEAIDLVRAESPQIMILDIKMPEMNGIQLLDYIKELDTNIQIIVSSGYSDFDAARHMLSIGKVVDYLLKPVNTDMLFEAVNKCITNIELKQKQELVYSDLKDARSTLRMTHIRDLIFGLVQEDDAFDVIQPPVRDNVVAVGLFSMGNEEAQVLLHDSIERDGLPEYFFINPDSEYAVLFFEGTGPEIAKEAHRFSVMLSQKYGATIGLSRPNSDGQDLNISYQEALLTCESGLITSHPVRSFEELDQEHKHLLEWDKWVSQMQELVQKHDDEQIEDLLQHISLVNMQNSISTLMEDSEAPSEGDHSLSLVKARMADFLEGVFSGKKTQLNLSTVFNAKNYRGLYNAAKDILCSGDNLEMLDRQKYRMLLIQKVKDYIKVHYGEHITLDSIASMVYLNPSYFSHLFSECEDCSFIEYLTNIRLSHAKELLRTTDLKIYEIADQIGYRNAKYFIKVFKDREGISPAQYREKHIFDSLQID